MKKRLIAMAVAGAVAAPLAAQADDVEVSGFADIIYTLQDESADPPSTTPNATNPNENKFTADAEIDVIAKPAEGVTARLDIDLDLVTNGGMNVNNSDSARIEQAFFAWDVTEQVGLIGGVFNNPIGQEAEDKPDINFINHSAVFTILDNQTTLNGNNVAGVAVAGGTDMFGLTLAYLNDIQQADEENSIALVVNVTPLQDVEFEFGYVTQDDDEGLVDRNGVLKSNVGAGNVWDINGQWSNIMGSGVTAGFDFLQADSAVDTSWNIWAGIDLPMNTVVRARYQVTTFALDNTDRAFFGMEPDDSTEFVLYGAWQATNNLQVALEYASGSVDDRFFCGTPCNMGYGDGVGINDGSRFQVQFLATLP